MLSYTHTLQSIHGAIRHRWMLLMPVLIALVVMTLWQGWVKTPEETIADATRLRAEPAEALSGRPDGTYDLSNGTLLAFTRGMVSVHAGRHTVHAWAGGVHVTNRNGPITVAAFDVPVLVEGEVDPIMVPPYSQWRGSMHPSGGSIVDIVSEEQFQPLPEHFVREQEKILMLWKTELPEISAINTTANLLSKMETHTLASIATVSQTDPLVAAAVRSRKALALYASLHPHFRDAQWGYNDLSDVDTETWLGLLQLPRMDRGEEGGSAVTIRRWGEMLGQALSSSGASSIHASVLSYLEDEVFRLAEDGHPLRAIRYADALRNAAGTGNLLASLNAITPDSFRPDPSPLTASVIQVMQVPAQIERDPMLEAAAREQLAAHGGMFTPKSEVSTVGAGRVEVRDVVFGLPSGDRPLHFEYEVSNDTVHAIDQGVVQPYAVPFAGYLEWISGGR